MYDRETMVAIGDLERTKISYSLAVLLITLCVMQTSSEVNICSRELSNIQCRGRCAAAASTKVRTLHKNIDQCFNHEQLPCSLSLTSFIGLRNLIIAS